jgi:hypothetical protein
MRYNELIETLNENEIEIILINSFTILGRHEINSDGTVDIIGHCKLKILTNKLPVKFNNISGYFDCVSNKLTSLINAPVSVGAYFNCADNKLTSLINAPVSVGGYFNCVDNKKLISLEGMAKTIGEFVNCSWSPNLPLLRTLVAKKIFIWKEETIYDEITKILNKYAGKSQDKAALQDCSFDLIKAGFAGNANW